eukprot:2503395-Amphidinium_carterae.1
MPAGVRTEHMVHVTSPKDTLKYVLPVLLPSNNIEMGQVVAVVDACSGNAYHLSCKAIFDLPHASAFKD